MTIKRKLTKPKFLKRHDAQPIKQLTGTKNERGAAMVIALIIVAAFILIALTFSRTIVSISRAAERSELEYQEKTRADYYVSIAEATLKYDVRDTYDRFQIQGKQKELQLNGDGKLPMFDPLTAGTSRPLLDLNGAPTGQPAATATSLYGASAGWLDTALAASNQFIADQLAQKNVANPDGVSIVNFREVYRRNIPGLTEPIYAFRYTVRGIAGSFGESVREDTVLLGPAISEDSPAVANCSDLSLSGIANPSNVVWGNSSNIELTYAQAERISIYNSGGASVFTQPVTIEPTSRMVSYNTGPLSGPTSYIGEAVRGTCQIQVPILIGVSFNQNLSYTVNGVQTVNIIEGENIRYDWQVSDAASGYTSSWITYGADTNRYYQNIYSNSINVPGPVESTTSTLHATDSRYNGGSEQSVTVNINVCRLPRITNFTVTPAAVTQGGNQTVRFDWQTQFASAIRIVRLTDGQVLYTGTDAAGSWSMPQPQAAEQYRLEAISDCGAAPATATVTISVSPPACTAPTINSFAVNPAIVVNGESQNIIFTWNVSGTIDSQSIDQGIGIVTGMSVTTLQPQTNTTYTLTVSGCGQTRQMQVTVTVDPPTGGFCPVAPAPGGPDATYGGGMAGQQNLPNCSCNNAEFRLMYRVSHYPDGTFRFNAQLYYSYSDPRGNGAITTPSFAGSQYTLEFGRLKVRMENFGVRFFDGATGAQIGYKAWGTQTFAPGGYDPTYGYVQVGLVDDGMLTPGYQIPAVPFDFTNDVMRSNTFTTQAYTLRTNTFSYPSALLNVGVSGSPNGRWRCPS